MLGEVGSGADILGREGGGVPRLSDRPFAASGRCACRERM